MWHWIFPALTFYFTHLPLVLHICVSDSGQHCFRQWLVVYSMSSYYLNQYWVFVNWTLRNKLQWNLNRNTKIFIHENALKISSAKWRPFCPGGDELTHLLLKPEYSRRTVWNSSCSGSLNYQVAVSLKFHELSKIFSQNMCICQNRNFYENCKLKLCTCAKIHGHTY